jgi:tetratricopeptide (TPR) repeat protein
MFRSQFKNLHEIEQLFLEGKIELALNKIHLLEKEKKLTNKEKIICKLHKSNLLFEQCNYEKSRILVEESLTESKSMGNNLLTIQSLLVKTRNYLHLKKFENCESFVKQIEQLQKKLTKDEQKDALFTQQNAILLDYKGEIAQNKGDLNLALIYANESLKIIEQLESKFGKAKVFTNIGKIFSTKGELEKALDYFQKSLKIWDQIGNKRKFAKGLMHIGNIYTDKGELDKALEYFKECLETCQETNDKHTLANSLGSIGINHAIKGELDTALDYFQESLEICNQIKDKQILAKNLGSIGIIHHSKGELRKALDYYHKSLEMNREIGNTDGVVIFLGNIGEIHRLKGELDEALEYYRESLKVYENIGGKSIPMALALVNSGLVYQQKGESKKALEYFDKGFEIFRDHGNIQRMAEVYFFEISILIDIAQLDQAKDVFSRLQGINAQEESKLISQMTWVSEALLLKTNKRAKNRAKAEELLLQIIEEEVINYEVYLVALINLSELHLIELQLTGDLEALSELKKLMTKQITFAMEQKSYSLLVETYFLQAQLALVELDIENAQKLLNQSHQIAQEKGLTRLAMKVSSEYDYYFEEKEMWEEFTDKQPPIGERLSHTRLEETILRMIKKRAVEPPTTIDEEPVLLLVVSEIGIPMFSQYFGPETQINDYLIGGFLTAINAFMKEAFATGGSIERIKHQEYTLVLHFKKTLGFCYVFKGPSYQAMNKFSDFIQLIESETYSKVIEALVDSKSSQKISSAHKTILEKLAKEIFLA